MDGECSTHGGDKCIRSYSWRSFKEDETSDCMLRWQCKCKCKCKGKVKLSLCFSFN